MVVKDGERIVLEEDISPEAIVEIEPIIEQMEQAKRDMTAAEAHLSMIRSKVEYLHKLKWSLFAKHNPATSEKNFTPGPGMNARQEYDWGGKKVALIEYPLGADGGGIAEMLMEALGAGFRRPKKPKSPDPESTPAAPAETTVP